MNKKIKKVITGLLFFPFIAAAQVNAIIQAVTDTLNDYVIPFLFVLATLIFIWGVIQYVAKSDDEAARAKARGLMLWGIIGLAVMLAVWGIVAVVIDYFGVGGVGIPEGIPAS